MTWAFSAIFFLSGAAALVFETVWFRQAGLMFGNGVWASSLVLASFMGGLALGSVVSGRVGDRLRRPLRSYALLESTIAVSGLGLVLLFPRITPLLAPLFRPFVETPQILNPLRLALASGLMLVPATAMGATLPILVRALASRHPDFGQAVGLLYGWNTLGAVAGSLAGEVFLIDRLGIRGAGATAAGLDVAAAVATLALASRLETGSAAPRGVPPRTRLTAAARALLAAALLAGATLLALEVVWFRFLQLFVMGTSLTFAAMLATVLLGIGLGSLGAYGWLHLQPDAERQLAVVAGLAGLATVITYAAFTNVTARYGSRYIVELPLVLEISSRLMLPTCFLSGALFALLGKRLKEEISGESRTAAMLTLANTVGATAGALLGGFILLPSLGVEGSLVALASCYALVAAAVWSGRNRGVKTSLGEAAMSGAAALALVAALSFFPSGLMKNHFMRVALTRWRPMGGRVIAVREGLLETITYLRTSLWDEPVFYRLLVNGFSMSASSVFARRYMNLFVYLPVALHPAPKKALLISYGVGSTAKALTDTTELSTIDIVDISRDVLEMSRVVFQPPDRCPLDDPRVRVHIEDGRFFLLTTDQRFDIITAEPPPPKNAGVVNLYSREYFQLAYDRLADGGMLSHWLPVGQMHPRESKAIIAGFCSVFEDCSLWSGAGHEWVLLGSRGARGPVTEERLARQWGDPTVARSLRSVGFESPDQLGAVFIADATTLRGETQGTEALDDDHPRRIVPDFVFEPDPFYAALMDTRLTRGRFESSAFIRRTWPEGARRRSLSWFGPQAWLNRFFSAGDRPASISELASYLAETSVRTPVLWLLGTSVSEQEIAKRAAQRGIADPYLAQLLAAEALAGRDYLAAEAGFEKARAGSAPSEQLLQLQALALCLGGRRDSAGALVARAGGATHPTDRAGWEWLEKSCGVPSPMAATPRP